ncbi:MAG TPA: Yip1 family protein [Thermoanaerobaculia bacterium]|nr:Yip1 family protein [Thermoanaerobaculia bacterium]
MIQEAGRLFRVFVAPGEVFREIREKPTWGLGFLLFWALGALSAYLLLARVDFIEVLESQFTASGRPVPPNLDQSAGMAHGCAMVFSAIGPPIICLLIAAIFLAMRLFGGDFNFRQSLAITVHGLMPRTAAALVSIPVILSRDHFSAQEMKTASFLFSNLGFLAPENAAPWLSTLLVSLDVFTLASLVLLSLGYHIAGKVPRSRAFLSVFGLWLVSVAVQVGLAAMQGLR